MSDFEHLRLERDERQVATVTIDAVGRPVNVFDEALLSELHVVLEQLQSDPSLRLVVFQSGKESGFLAGADVHRIQEIATPEEADTILNLGQQLFQRIASLPTPTLAVIHGPCLGGGLEFALACQSRIARDEGSTRLGLPETQLGLIPAWGGTQRLTRTIGVAAAARMILQARRVSAAEAKRLRLIDAAFAPDRFSDDVAGFVDGILQGQQPVRPSSGWTQWLRDETTLGQKAVLWLARRQVARHSQHYPALTAALRAMEVGLADGFEAGLGCEREEFCRLLFLPQCRHLLDLFLLRERARRRSTWVGEGLPGGKDIRSVGVIGAGTMGAGIAQLAATSGYRVVLQDVDDSQLKKGTAHIERLTHQAVTKGAFDSERAREALAAISTATRPDALQGVDLVVEAIVERLDIKQQVFRTLDGLLPDHVRIVSNTSALPISEMARATDRVGQVAGLHFFNPVHKMPLVEVVRCPSTSDETIAALIDVVRRLGKTPLVVREGPGFLVNRILFPYLDEAVRMVCEGLPVDQIDRAARRFGMPMGPLQLLDTVGLDVAADVSQTLAGLSLQESPTPGRLAEMVAAGQRGQKSGQGFYAYRKGRRGKPITFERTGRTATLPAEAQFTAEKVDGLTQRLVLAMVNAAAGTLQDRIVSAPWMVDLGMVLGTGFAPFRGGPMALIEAWGREPVVTALQNLNEMCGPRYLPSDYFAEDSQETGADVTETAVRDPIGR